MSQGDAPRNRKAAAALTAGGLFCLLACLGGCERRAEDLRTRCDRSLARAAAYLLHAQSPDGAWRSKTYGALTDDVSLTAPVLKTVLLGPGGTGSRAACEHAATHLRAGPPDGALDYPVYSAALAAIVLNRLSTDGSNDEADRAAREAWLEYLRGFQLNERLGWDRDDDAFGGWGYSVHPPRKPTKCRLPFEADISSTLFAVGALRLAGASPEDRAVRDALVFVKRCQNFAGGDREGEPAFDDGGFFFTPAGTGQNKAGVAGTDRSGAIRYHAYGSATADGLRALVHCGLPPDHPRVLAALAWIERNFSETTNPGVFEPSLAADRDAAFYYWSCSVTHALRRLGITESPGSISSPRSCSPGSGPTGAGRTRTAS